MVHGEVPMNMPSDDSAAKGSVVPVDPQPESKAKALTASVRRARPLPSGAELKGRWKQRIGAAKIAWGKLTEDELLKIEGHEEKLSGLIQQRYAITRNEAVKQVKAFFFKHRS
jgi:uncharacterized protein YjbJ (UPF0337 family)